LRGHSGRAGRRKSDVRFGSKADICGAKDHVRFTPDSDTKCDIMECPQRPIADITHLFDHLVGASEQRRRHSEAQCLGEIRVAS
ncbi:MAG TPA: hypothetical protein VKG24_07080, partial [Pseudolabrys sp.]|nr:hypothetical protein [Pseudolabrys sp.]